MIRIFPLLIILIDILAIIDVLRSHRDTERKVIWILVILILPIIGPLAWYAVSRNIVKF